MEHKIDQKIEWDVWVAGERVQPRNKRVEHGKLRKNMYGGGVVVQNQ